MDLVLSCEETFRAVDVVVAFFLEEQLMNFKHGPAAPPKSNKILMHGVVAAIQFHVEKSMTKLVLKTVTAQYKWAHERVSTTLVPLIKRIVKKVSHSP